jgi:hypothetical protein
MRVVLKSLDLEPDPSTPDDAAEFSLLARMIVVLLTHARRGVVRRDCVHA